MNSSNKFREFVDAEDYSTKEKTTFEDLVMLQLRKISEIVSNDLVPGYWNEIATPTGIARTYHPDGMVSYNNAVNYLHDILLPKFDEEMFKVDEEIKKKVKEISEISEKENDRKGIRLIFSLKRELFQQINLLLKRIRFFDNLATGE